MKRRTPSGDTGMGIKNGSDAIKKPITTRTLAGVALVLLGAAGIGMIIREFRFRSSGEKHPAQAPKAVQPRDIPETMQTPKESEIQDIQEELPIEGVFVEPESLASESINSPTTSMEDTEAQAETAAEPFEQDSQFDDPRAKEHRARVALSMIGYDPDADEIWIRLINDPSLSANARSNLIEDLNEDGFADPDNPTLDELPMIEYRIELIEDLLPYAMDKVNSDAFKEARKDLVNMVDRLRER
ncbi:MAG: hypothetical protein ACYSUX_01590 [Planctomycetota bacterium]|jgi:hypothetical protein